MQKLLSKYSLAAHLALLTAAPLFLYPYVGVGGTSITLFAFSLFTAVWVLMEPSRRHGEMLHDARWRLHWSVTRSPVFYALLLLVGYSLVVYFNSGLDLYYDCESEIWQIHEPRFVGLPASVDGSALPALAVSVALLVAVIGVRYGLGRAARAAYLFLFSLASGIAGIALAISLVEGGNARVLMLVRNSAQSGSFVGCAFAIALLAGVAAIPSAFERGWMMVTTLFIPAIGGSFIGMLLCATEVEFVVFSMAAVVMLGYGVVYSVFAVRGPGSLKCLAVFGLAIAAGVAFLAVLVPEWAGAERLQHLGQPFLPQDFEQIRRAIDNAVLKAWKPVSWIGTGVGTLGWDIRFHALEEDWLVLPPNVANALDGWVAVLAERGFTGAVAVFTVAASIFAEWTYRLVRAVIDEGDRRLGGELYRLLDPQAWVGLVGALAVGVAAYFGETAFSPAALLAAAALSACSINVFRMAVRYTAETKSRSAAGNG